MIRAGFLQTLGTATLAQAAPYTPTLRIAVVAPQSGADARLGRQLLDGVRAAVDYANNERMLSERALVFDSFDDRNTAADATVQSSFAADNPDVSCVIGHLSATATIAALPTYGQRNLPLVVPTVTDDRLTAQGYRNVFRLPPKDADEGALLARYVVAAGAKNPVVVTQDGDYGAGVAQGFQRGAAALHVQAAISQFPVEKPDFAREADVLAGKQPDSITLAGTASDMGPLVRALRARGYTGRLSASQGFFDAALTSTYAKDAEGMIISTDVPYYPLAPTAVRYVQDYQGRYGQLTPVAAYGYAAVQLIRLAARRTGAFNRLTLLRALASGGTYDTITGSYSFGPSGDAIDPNCYFYAVRGGAFVYERQARPGGFMLR